MIVASAFSEWFCRRVAAKWNGGDGFQRVTFQRVTFQGLTLLAINLRRVAAKENIIFRVTAKDNTVLCFAAIESIQSAI
jgi:hypothetical protein